MVIYVKNEVSYSTQIGKFDDLSILNIELQIKEHFTLKISALYRCHDLDNKQFINSLEKFIKNSSTIKNHCIIGDFNIDLMNINPISQDF